jgi:hypothetical protein
MSFDPSNLALSREFVEEVLSDLGAKVSVEGKLGRIRLCKTFQLTLKSMCDIDFALGQPKYKVKIKLGVNQSNAGLCVPARAYLLLSRSKRRAEPTRLAALGSHRGSARGGLEP